ncbi:hypothetical protein [Arcobacter sp. FWKO B]|uniref:hypothetical protein n=1 Tax=Arcobacter sp. FWKO B TaxID=2593672 RepID=UPI0018A58AFE|nr:hypothetical protein [Arcobacter sp. FWKO B]QOG11735.1 hypothetical protein FWKOB_03020 [Arcobacter sp. FWKO B]
MSQNDVELQSLLFATLVQKQSAFEAQAQKNVVLGTAPIQSEYNKLLSEMSKENSIEVQEEQINNTSAKDLNINSSLYLQSNLMKQVFELKSLMQF